GPAGNLVRELGLEGGWRPNVVGVERHRGQSTSGLLAVPDLAAFPALLRPAVEPDQLGQEIALAGRPDGGCPALADLPDREDHVDVVSAAAVEVAEVVVIGLLLNQLDLDDDPLAGRVRPAAVTVGVPGRDGTAEVGVVDQRLRVAEHLLAVAQRIALLVEHRKGRIAGPVTDGVEGPGGDRVVVLELGRDVEGLVRPRGTEPGDGDLNAAHGEGHRLDSAPAAAAASARRITPDHAPSGPRPWRNLKDSKGFNVDTTLVEKEYILSLDR